MKLIPTAYSTHTACFICLEKGCSLYQVKEKDRIHAYVNHRIIIKSHARLCDAHFDENRLIRKEEFFCIPTKDKPYCNETIQMYDLLSKNYYSPFEQFREMKYLEDEHCKNITGWSKAEFIIFSQFITSVRITKKRTKEQLIALYRYWLHTGIDQKSLAFMFSSNAKQNRISEYLSQIRLAIMNDFTPHFLGANKERDFYLKYNTIATQNLHSLPKDHLVVIADGTYCKIEKSKNNDFQYNTYSVQKKSSLVKPFLICCADGYIIDCYGPFGANNNDATILNYILDNDSDLKKLLMPTKTLMLLDRGK